MSRSPSLLLLLAAAAILAAGCGDAKPPAAQPVAPAPAPAEGVDAVSEAAASYRVVAAVTPGSVARGGKAALGVEIVMTRPDVHVQAEFPLKVTLVATPGLAIEKALLGHAEAVDPAAKGRRWEVPVAAKAAGPQKVDVVLRFALCKETEPLWCVTRNEAASLPLEVR
jgi:hypothetical protein